MCIRDRISTYIVAEFGRSSFLRNLHLKLSTFSSSFFNFPEISLGGSEGGYFCPNFYYHTSEEWQNSYVFSLCYNVLPKSCSLIDEKAVEIRWPLEKAEKCKIQRLFHARPDPRWQWLSHRDKYNGVQQTPCVGVSWVLVHSPSSGYSSTSAFITSRG